MLGRDANNSRLTSQVTEHKKKSEPFAYRLWFWISTVWCRWWDSEPRRTAFGIKLHEQIEKGKVAGSLKWFLTHQPTSKEWEHAKAYPSCFGAGGGTRTHTMSPSTDFESVTSANSITPAYIYCPGGQQIYCIILFRKSQVLPENFFAEGLYFSESGLYSIRSAMPQPRASQNFSSR